MPPINDAPPIELKIVEVEEKREISEQLLTNLHR